MIRFDPVFSGVGVLVEGVYRKRAKHVILDSTGTKVLTHTHTHTTDPDTHTHTHSIDLLFSTLSSKTAVEESLMPMARR